MKVAKLELSDSNIVKKIIPHPRRLYKRTLSRPVKIFISYRRDDSAGYAGHLCADLRKHFGEGNVFIDVDMERGKDFVEIIQNEISSSSVFIAVIGRFWVANVDNTRNLENPNDYVRLEVGIALKQNIQVIPVLVHGASMPEANLLPADLLKVTRLNAIQLSDTRWRYDVDQLITVLEKAVEEWQEKQEKEIERKRRETQQQAEEHKRQAEISTLLSYADRAILKEDWVLAINKLERVLKINPHHKEALLKVKDVHQLRRAKLESVAKSSDVAANRQLFATHFVKSHMFSIGIAAAFIFLGIIWFSQRHESLEPVQPSNISNIRTIQVEPTPLIHKDPISYEDLFLQSKNRPDAPFAGSEILIKGPIRGCEPDPSGKLRVYFGVAALSLEGEREPGRWVYPSRIENTKDPSGVYCLFNERPSLICKGSQTEATLIGVVDGKIGNHVIIKNCRVVKGND